MGTVDLPRFALFDGPSPFHRLPRFSAALGGRVDVWIKREDLLPVAFGGNKLRNLEFLVGAALADGADTLVTSGRRWSNHCRLTAAAGAMAGLDVHLVLSGPPTDPPNPGVVLGEVLGATVHQGRTDERIEREALVEEVVGDLRTAGRHVVVVGVGGSGWPGTWGQVLAGRELIDQLAALAEPIHPALVVLPTATGGTQAGLTVANGSSGLLAGSVVGIAVARRATELRPIAETQVADLVRLAELAPIPADAIVIDDAQLGEGYGRPTIEADIAARLLARTEGILVDPIYTAKALAGLVDRVRGGALDGEAVVFWHAGGTPGVLEPLDP